MYSFQINGYFSRYGSIIAMFMVRTRPGQRLAVCQAVPLLALRHSTRFCVCDQTRKHLHPLSEYVLEHAVPAFNLHANRRWMPGCKEFRCLLCEPLQVVLLRMRPDADLFRLLRMLHFRAFLLLILEFPEVAKLDDRHFSFLYEH